MSIEQHIRAMGNKAVERQLNRPPLRVGLEGLAVRLPRPSQGVRPQMNGVLLAVAEYVEFDPAPGAGIDDPTIGREIEGDLNKAVIVLEADVATHANGGPTGDCIADHGPFGDAAHDLVGEELPVGQLLPIAAMGGSRLRSSMIADVTDIAPPLSAFTGCAAL